MLRLNIGIAGGGLGGLAAAVALGRLGHDVTVYEAAAELRQVGAGIQMTPNASKILLRWGLDEFLPELRIAMSSFVVRRWKDGREIGRLKTEAATQRFGGPYVQVYRADLQSALLKAAQRHGVQVLTGSPIVDFDFALPALVLASGATIEKDLILGADGIKSLARHKLSGIADLSTIDTGLAVYRASLSADDVLSDPDVAHLVKEPGLNLWIGPHQHAVVYTMKGGSLVNMVLEYAEPNPPSSWDSKKYVSHARQLVQSWDPSLRKLYDKITSALKWPLRFSQTLDTWSSLSGKFFLIGDAAHVVPSFLAQGAAMAIEDAAALAKLLGEIESREEIRVAVKQFENSRIPRKKQVQDMSLHNLHLFHLEDGEDQRQRDAGSTENPELNPIWNDVGGQGWLYGHDCPM